MSVKGFRDTIDWYDNNAEQYAETAKRFSFAESIEEFLHFLPAHPKVLEAGCGSGRDARVFKDKGAEVVGVDVSEGLLKVARTENPDIEFVSANFINLPFKDETFDGIWSHASLVHFETLEEVRQSLAEFNRVLKKDGFLYILVKLQQGEVKTEVVSDILSKHDRFFRYFEQEEMTGLLREAELEAPHYLVIDDPHGRTEIKWLKTIVKKAR